MFLSGIKRDLTRERTVTIRSVFTAGLTLLFLYQGMNWLWFFGKEMNFLEALILCLAIGCLAWRSAMALTGFLFRLKLRKKESKETK